MSFNLLATQINNFLQPIQFNTCGDMCNDRMGICVLADHGESTRVLVVFLCACFIG